MKIQDGPAYGALFVGMGLAFLLNHADKPIWLSLLAGMSAGSAIYLLIIRLKLRGIS